MLLPFLYDYFKEDFMNNVPKPVNTQEEYMHAIVMRLDALCHMMSSFIETYANQQKVATTKQTTTRKRATKKVEE